MTTPGSSKLLILAPQSGGTNQYQANDVVNPGRESASQPYDVHTTAQHPFAGPRYHLQHQVLIYVHYGRGPTVLSTDSFEPIPLLRSESPRYTPLTAQQFLILEAASWAARCPALCAA